MMNALIALGLGIIIFALIAGVGAVILSNFGTAVAGCTSPFTWNYTNSQTYCCNQTAIGSGGACAGTNATLPSLATRNNVSLMGYINNNLITWVPSVIALGIGLLFIGSLMGKKNKF